MNYEVLPRPYHDQQVALHMRSKGIKQCLRPMSCNAPLRACCVKSMHWQCVNGWVEWGWHRSCTTTWCSPGCMWRVVCTGEVYVACVVNRTQGAPLTEYASVSSFAALCASSLGIAVSRWYDLQGVTPGTHDGGGGAVE